MNDNHPVRSVSANVGGDADLAHSFFLQEASIPPHRKCSFSTLQFYGYLVEQNDGQSKN
jgi:hypothetical protein